VAFAGSGLIARLALAGGQPVSTGALAEAIWHCTNSSRSSWSGPTSKIPGQPGQRNLAQLTALAKTLPTPMKCRPVLLEGLLTSTGLDLTPFSSPQY
jgi:hypothetical protein